MVAYTLNDPLEFIGCEIGGPYRILQVFKAPGKDAANPSNRAFQAASGVSIGASNPPAQYTELKVFNGSIKGSGLDSLIQDLKDQNVRVNRDGYQYIRIPGRRIPGTGISLPAKFTRLNDLFPWADYVDDPASFDPNPSSTIWNRRDLSSNDKKVDYEKLETDLKQAIQDKKTAEADKVKGIKDAEDNAKKKYDIDLNKAKGEYERKLDTAKTEHKNNLEKAKKEYERKLETAKTEHKNNLEKAKKEYERKLETAKTEHKNNLEKAKQKAYERKLESAKDELEAEVEEANDKVKEMTEMMDRVKMRWNEAARLGARPIPSYTFIFSDEARPRYRTPLGSTWMGTSQLTNIRPMTELPGVVMQGQRIVLHNAKDVVEPYFWWAIQVDYPLDNANGTIIAFQQATRYPYPLNREKFSNVVVSNFPGCGNVGIWDLNNCNWIVLRSPRSVSLY